MNKFLFFLLTLLSSSLCFSYDVTEDLQLHGFFTQNAINTSGNNMYGDSKNSVSADYSEAALNAYYTPFEKVSFSMQVLYRNAGEVDNDKVDIDYAFVDFNLNEYESGDYGLRLGRVKNPLGLYNETRDVAFTTPSIILPQGIYYDRSRALLRATDGAQFHLYQRFNSDDISFKLIYGEPRNDNDELLDAIIPYPTPVIPVAPNGDLDSTSSELSVLSQITYEQNGGEFIYSLSYADVTLEYDSKGSEPFTEGSTGFELFILSAQYNGEKFSLTGEYLLINNDFKDFGPLFPDLDSPTESWYVQGGYRFKPKWQIYARYDEQYLNSDDKSGKSNELIGLPGHSNFTKDTMLGVRWDINSSMMVRAEYHNINGTGWLTKADNPDRQNTERYWDLFALQFSVRF